MSARACLLTLTLVAGSLAGCATVPRAVEAPVSDTVPVQDELGGASGADIMLGSATRAEIVRIIAGKYPPAQTRLVLRGAGDDTLGRAVMTTLREHGYAVEEASRDFRDAQAGGGLPLTYRFAAVHDDPNLYELSISVGPLRLSRAYVRSNDGNVVAPGGDWTLRE